ncbi:MAG: hypothetical protein KDK27_02690, partial [Leptospiraceae bacterium]|nr:hypothetical protein [Leptospiraceae bacterium]
SLIFGKGYLRLVSLSIALYYVLLAMSIAWLPWSNRFFALFFAVSAPNLAFLIEKIGRFCWFRRTTLLVCIFQFLFAALLNISKPIINVYEITYKVAGAFNMQHLANYKLKKAGIQYPGPMVFTWIHYIFDRGAYVRVYYMSDPLKLYAESVKPNDRVLILATPDSPVLPFLMVDSEVIVKLDGVHSIRDSDINEDVRRTHYDYVLYIGLDAPKDIAEENVIFNIPASLSGYTPVTLLRTQ